MQDLTFITEFASFDGYVEGPLAPYLAMFSSTYYYIIYLIKTLVIIVYSMTTVYTPIPL